MKSKSPALSQLQPHSSLFETPKKKISSSVDGCKSIAEDDLQTPKNKRRSSTKKSQRKRRPSESDEEKIDIKTEENIQQVALKNNLTEDAVKKILKKVVSNDHVLAIVKLKEEEMERNDQSSRLTVDDDEEDHEDVEHAPKITRSKAKVLNKKILPITSPSEPSEASILIQQEFGSDDEDEEYEPGNDDVHSDDDHNSSVSDMDSQPRTPKTPYTAEEDTPTKYTVDGVFKIPRDRNDSSTSQNDQDYIIAKRTRSKVSLATTSIETIESTFQPPDISPDMYDRDNELDSDWLEFLNVLTKPINQTVEDDDETDPEYVAAADKIPIDKEELREVNISKKELSDLVDELFSNLSDVDFDEINKYDIYPELLRTKQRPHRSDTNQELNRSDVQSDDGRTFQPTQMSTPTANKVKPIENTLSNTIAAVDESTISILSNLTENQSTLMSLHNQTSTIVAVNAVNPFQGATIANGVIQVPQHQQILIQIPTIDILKIQAQQQQHQQQHINTSNAAQSNVQSMPDCWGNKSSFHQQKLFQHLKTDPPVASSFDESHVGFTHHQRDILDQQLRMHVQFAAQNYLQVYGNPGNDLWKQAPKFKSFLTELDDLTTGTCINIANLQPALNVISRWEEDLMQPDTDENKDYAEFLLGESKKSQKAVQAKCTYKPRFSERLMDVVAQSVAFPYPHLLPKIPFRMDFHGRSFVSEFIPVEDYLIAFHLEKIEEEYREERLRNRIETTRKKISLERLCDRICSRMCPFRLSNSKNPVYRYVVRKKSKPEVYNPIQYYFDHNKAAPFKHDLIKFDCNNQRAPKECPIVDLPSPWSCHIKQLLAIEHSKQLELQNKHSKPVQKVIPQVRSKAVQKSNVIKPQSSQTNNFTKNIPAKTTAQPRPIFVLRSKNDSTVGSVHYEILQVDADTQFEGVESTQHINATDISAEVPVDDCPNGVIEVNEYPTKETHKILGNHSSEDRNDVKSPLTRKLSQIVGWLQSNYFKVDSNVNRSDNLLIAHTSVRNFSIYMIFVQFDLEMANFLKRLGKDKGDELKSKSKLVDDIVEQPDCNNPSTSASVNVSTKKNPKAQRSDNTRLMLLPETKEDINEKDLVYAQNFMDKVEEVYAAENKMEKVADFLRILQTFNQSNDKVEELYYKMEQLFLPDHPELAELFLTFLMPGHAAQIGKFMEHFMLTNMNNFINKLNIYFNKQPAQIRKIMTCLRDLSNEEDLKLDQIKMKIFPLLKGNPLLIEWFRQCFPNDTTNDSPTDEFESLNVYRAENAHQTDDDNDVYENVNQSEIVLSDPVDNPCHIRYLNGRMYYGSRILLPAKLSFLVVTASDQNAINEVAKSESSHSRPKEAEGNETEYRCVHSIKQYGDNKMKECQKNQLETPESSICEEVENDKSTDELNCSDAADDAELPTSECVQVDDKTLSSSAESLDISYNTCDDLTLKAHGIRLNPTVHQSNVIKSEDLLCLLDPIDDIAEKVSEESLKNSPKKHTSRAQRKSPNTKRATKRSPVNSKKSQQGTNVSAEDSNAIRTAKRLKRLIDDGDEPERLPKKPKLQKCTKSAADANKNRKNKSSTSDEVSGRGSNAKTESSPSAAETSAASEAGTAAAASSSTTSTTSTTWSRDEDKLVLEQIKMGFTNEENLVQTLHAEKLPNRSYSEIFERFKFLMDIIANL